MVVDNTRYLTGVWRPDKDIYNDTTYNVKSDFDLDIHCEWHQYVAGDNIKLYVDDNKVAESNSDSTPIDYSLKAGT